MWGGCVTEGLGLCVEGPCMGNGEVYEIIWGGGQESWVFDR